MHESNKLHLPLGPGLQAAGLSDISQRVNLGRLYCGEILENQWLVVGWHVGWQG